MIDEEKANELQAENQKLKEKLADYMQLEEDLLADKVFKKAKDKLVGWYTIGGIAVFVIGIIGVKSVVDYSKELVSKKLDTYSETKINEIIVGESHKQVEALLIKQQHTITQQFQVLYDDAKKKLDIVKNGYGTIESFDSLQSAPNVTTNNISHFDFSSSMNPIRDQASEGSPVAFTVAAALENSLFQNDNIKVSISPRYIYNSINYKNGQGAFFVDAFNFLSKTGAIEESSWPYKGGEFSKDPPASVANAKHYKISKYKTVKLDINSFKSILLTNNCIIVGIIAYNTIVESKDGVYQTPKSNDQIIGGHGVCIVGYDDTKKLLKFRNSWGVSWGDKGYGYIKYDDINELITDAYIIIL